MSCKYFCCETDAPSIGDFKKIARLPYSGLTIFLHIPKNEKKQQMYARSPDSVVLYNTSNKVIAKPDYIRELCLYNTCNECKPIINWVRSSLDEIAVIKENQIFGICEHCKKASSVKCKKCNYIVSKFIHDGEKRRGGGRWRCAYNLDIIENITESKNKDSAEEKIQDTPEITKVQTKIELTGEKEDKEQDKSKVNNGQQVRKKGIQETKSKNEKIKNTDAKIAPEQHHKLVIEKKEKREQKKIKNKENQKEADIKKPDERVQEKQTGKENKICKKDDKDLKENKKTLLEKQAAGKELQDAREARQAAAMREAELAEQMAKANLMNRLKSMKPNKSVIQSIIRQDKPSTKDVNIETVDKDSCIECVVESGLSKYYVKGSHLQPYRLNCKEEQTSHQSSAILFKKEYIFNDSEDLLPTTKSMSDTYGFPTSGVIKYQLSNKEFIDKGWTKLPTVKIMRKMNIYKLRPSRPIFDWFKIHKQQKILFYGAGEKLAEIDENCCGSLYYKNGAKALDHYSSEDKWFGHRYIVYSSGEEVESGLIKSQKVLALFDFRGNGVVYDYNGNVRMKYNQSEGVVIDRNIGPPGRWKWHSLNDPPVMQQVFLNAFPSVRDPDIENLEPEQTKETEKEFLYKQAQTEMLQIEMDNYVKLKEEKLVQKFKPFHIQMKAAKLNEHFSLKILEQSNIYLLYRDGPTSVKLNIGMDLISNEIIDCDISDMADIATPYDKYSPKTESMTNIQENLKYIAQKKL